MKRLKGSLVVYLVVFMPVLLLLFGCLLDVVRVKYVRSVVSECLYSGLDSVLADYDRGVFAEFGVFALRDKDYSGDFGSFVSSNLKGKGVVVSDYGVELLGSLGGEGVLKRQILEDMKVSGLVNFSKGFYEVVKGFLEAGELGGDSLSGVGAGGDYLESLQDRVGKNLEEIKSLESRSKAGESGLEGRIGELYQENKDLLVLIEDMADGVVDSGGAGGFSLDGETLGKLGELFRDDFVFMLEHFFDPEYVFYESRGLAADVNGALGVGFVDLRDRFLLNEYVLEHFSDVTVGEAEVEGIVGVGYPSNGMMEVLLLRTFLDGAGYFFFDSKAPSDPGERLVYSAGMGFLSGLEDTVLLASGAGERVALVRGEGFTSGFDSLRVSYRDHLGLLLFTVAEEYILGVVYDEVCGSLGGDGLTGAGGFVECGVELWFLSFLPDGFGFLGGVVSDGYWCFEESAELFFY